MNIAAFLFSSAKFQTEQRSSITSKNYELHKERAEMMSNFRAGSGVKKFAPIKGDRTKNTPSPWLTLLLVLGKNYVNRISC